MSKIKKCQKVVDTGLLIWYIGNALWKEAVKMIFEN